MTIRYGDTVVLVTAVASNKPREGVDFLPLTVDYRENTYAAGKIPGGFFRREGRPNEKEVLTTPTAIRCRVVVIGTNRLILTFAITNKGEVT